MFRSTRQFTRFAAQQGSDVFILLYVCSFWHGISFKDPREIPFRNSYAWWAPSRLILLTVNTWEAPSFNLGFSRTRFKKRGSERANERDQSSSWSGPKGEERRNWESDRGRARAREKGRRGGREVCAYVFWCPLETAAAISRYERASSLLSWLTRVLFVGLLEYVYIGLSGKAMT